MYLLQRGKIRKGVIDTLSKSVNLDYMGSSEFEWGALPKSLKCVRSNFGKYRRYITSNLVDINGRPLNLFHKFERDFDLIEYIKKLVLLSQDKIHLKEFSGFHANFDPNADEFLRQFDFWWDIETHVFFMFDEEFAKIFPTVLKNSFKVMIALEKADKKGESMAVKVDVK